MEQSRLHKTNIFHTEQRKLFIFSRNVAVPRQDRAPCRILCHCEMRRENYGQCQKVAAVSTVVRKLNGIKVNRKTFVLKRSRGDLQIVYEVKL